MSVRQIVVGSLVAMLLTACSGLQRGDDPDRLYVLRPAPASTAPIAVPGVLLVLRPAMQPGLENDRIALLRDGNELNYYAASRWGDTLSRVLAAFAVESLAGPGGFGTVASADRAILASNFELLLTVRHFEVQYADGASPVAQVAFECVLTTGAPRRVLGRCDVSASEPADENRMGEIVPALERATQRAMAEMRTKAVAAATAR